MDVGDDNEDDADLDAPLGSPVHPDDRLWRHPSELASAGLPSTVLTAGVSTGSQRWRRARSGRDHRRPAGRDRWLPAAVAGSVSALITAGLLAFSGALDGGSSVGQPSSTSSTLRLMVDTRTALSAVAEIAERLGPSLLALSGVGADGHLSRGSAVAIRAGYVLTAARLVVGAHDLEVVVKGVQHRATLVGSDPDTDLALLAIDGGGLVPIPWGTAADLRAGDPTVALSSPPAAEPGPTVTVGVVSGIDRTLAYAGTELRGLLLVDRPVTSEGAGGALVEPTGTLVGITLPAPVNAPFSYAVPAEVAKDVAAQLISRGRVAHPWLGVEGSDRGMNGGAVVQRVRPQSPAAAAGMAEGDVVTELDGLPTPSMGMLLVSLRLHQPGQTVRIVLFRDGRRHEILVTLAERS